MSSFDTQLLLIALASVLVLVALIVSRIRLHPLLALLVVSIGVGFATGMAPGEIVKNLTNGAGKTLGAVGVVIALGAMLGKILADSGTTERLASAILQRTSERMIPWAMTLVAFVIGIPMFFEVGLVVMLPLIFSVARKLESSLKTLRRAPCLTGKNPPKKNRSLGKPDFARPAIGAEAPGRG